MNEITRIHLAATPYNIEVSAKKDLEKYLGAIVKALGADEEALREIEARMVELLMERGVTGEKVMTAMDVEALQKTLGSPGDFAEASTPSDTTTTKKRLMRDSEAGMLGGVLSGLAAYTGVDVVWWRIATVILALVSFGTILMLYIILWIVMPRAETAAERLQMRGVEPTLERIQAEAAREVQKVPAKQKFLVVLLRIVGVLSLLGAALAACAVVVAGVYYISLVWVTDAWLLNAWLIGAAASGTVSGLLFAALMLLGVYALWAWRLTKRMALAASVVVALGLVSFGSALGTGVYGANVAQRIVEAHTSNQRVELRSQLADVKGLSVKDVEAEVIYEVTDGQPYAEVRSINRPGTQKARLVVDRQGESAFVRLQDIPEHTQCGIWGCGKNGSVVITIHGPAVERIQLDNAQLSYEQAAQDTLSAQVGHGSYLNLDGKVQQLNAMIDREGRVVASDASVDRATLDLTGERSSVDLGVVQQLALVAPKACGTDNWREVNYARADVVTLNGVPVATTDNPACITFHDEGAVLGDSRD